MLSASLTSWQDPPSQLSIDESVVHLWRFSLTDVPSASILNHAEQRRAEQLRVPAKARAFVAARTFLRKALGRYLDIAPRAVDFQYNEKGKPFLAGSPVKFNLSHSGNRGLCAVTLGMDVGVDLEIVDPELKYAALAQRFFSGCENSWLQGTPETRRRRNFFRLWTRKEAWLKGKGGGFSELKLELDPNHLGVTSTLAGGWWLMNVPVVKGYVGAVAVAGEVERVERWSWDE